METQVIIVGAGPVGLTLAIDLGRRGIACVLVEQKAEPQFLPKMERCNARTMEIFRRLGLADRIRAAGMPEDVAMDIQIIRSMVEPPILRLPYPSVAEARALTRECHDGSLPLEPYQLISQYTLEPLLLEVAEQLPMLTVIRNTTFLEFTEQDDGVLVAVNDEGVRRTLKGAYLVGCDGGASRLRKQLGIRLEGEGDIARLRQGLFYCEQLYKRLLAWKLAATLQGWGGPGLLASYETERRQIGERVVGASRYASLGYRAWLAEVRPEIGDDTPAGSTARAHLADVANVEQRKSNEMIGAELGYRYVDSPVIDNVPGGPPHDLRAYLPTTWPGARLPHMWLTGSSAIQDRLRSERYTLIDVAGGHDAGPLLSAFEALGAPLDVLVVADSRLRAVYKRDLVLVRPDMHVAWRGDRLPQAVDDLAAKVTGHSNTNRASGSISSR